MPRKYGKTASKRVKSAMHRKKNWKLRWRNVFVPVNNMGTAIVAARATMEEKEFCDECQQQMRADCDVRDEPQLTPQTHIQKER
jgi:hypothetical protein